MTNSYPSVSFSTKTTLPPPRTLPWRGTVGVVGTFERGPAGATRVTPETFKDYYGFDSSSGSIAVQQAMAMGASDFVISRAVPRNTAATSVISFGSENALNVPPTIGYELQNPNDLNPTVDSTNYTTGLRLDLNFVGAALVARTLYENVAAQTNVINHPYFNNEQANLSVFVADFKQGGTTIRQSNLSSSLTAETSTAAIGDHQIIQISTIDGVGNNIDTEADNLLPGYILTDGTQQLLILSRPYRLNVGSWGLLVENLTATTAGVAADLVIQDPPTDRYVFGYNLQTTSGRVLRPRLTDGYYYVKANETFDDGYNNNVIHSYFSLDASTGGEWHEFLYDVSPVSSITGPQALVRERLGDAVEEGLYFLFGIPGNTTAMRLALRGQFVIPFAKASITVGSDSAASTLAFEPGTDFAAVLRQLRSSLYGDLVAGSLLEEVTASTSTFPYTLSMKTKVEGTTANRIFFNLERYTSALPADARDIFIKVDDFDFNQVEFGETFRFSNAFQGPRGGFRDYYSLDGTPILRIVSVTPGLQNVVISMVPDELSSPENPNMNVTVVTTQNGITSSEVGQLRTDSIDIVSGLFQNTGLQSVVAYFLPLLEPAGGTVDPSLYTLLPLRSAPPLGRLSSVYNTGVTSLGAAGTQAITALPLEGSSDSVTLAPTLSVETVKNAYLEAVRNLEAFDVAFVVIVGLPYGFSVYSEVFDAAIDQAQRASPESGLRQVFFETPFNMSPRQSSFLSDSIRNEYVTLVNGHITMPLGNGTFAARVSTLGYYAGLLSSRPPHIAPHANYNGQYLRDVVNSTSKSDPDSKNQYSRGRIESLHFDRGLGRWKFLNGLTTSTDPTKRYVSVVRLRLQLMSDLQNYLQWVLSEPNTRALQRKVETSVEAYMNSRLQEGWFLRLGDVICNESNNTETDMSQGKLYVDLSYVPVVPADFIFVNINEDYTILDSLSFDTRPGTAF